MSTNVTLLLLCSMLVASGCKSPEERCREAQDEAKNAWSALHVALAKRQKEHDEALAEVHIAARKISFAISTIATEEANRLYDRGPAWTRHYEMAYGQACAKDVECTSLEKKRAALVADAKTLAQRVVTSESALEAALSPDDEAWEAASKVEMDSNDPLSVAADKAARASHEACKPAIE